VSGPVAAQPPRSGGRGLGPEPSRPPLIVTNAGETQAQLYQVLQQYPPSLRQVLRMDPTLLTSDTYLEPYPALAAFLADHPEIAHNPAFFLGESRDDNRTGGGDPRLASIRMMEDSLAGLAVLTGFLAVVGVIAWVLRSVIEHRRWLRVSKTQTETHTKLLDRLTSNEDLMAYMQSPAGRRFLEAAPIPLTPGPKALSAPLGRILWSVQAGCVIAFAGAGLMYASRRFGASPTFTEIELPLFLMGATTLAIGAGFVVSAGISYGLSRRLGLLSAAGLPASHPAETDARPLG
jgi:hypothetical protein